MSVKTCVYCGDSFDTRPVLVHNPHGDRHVCCDHDCAQQLENEIEVEEKELLTMTDDELAESLVVESYLNWSTSNGCGENC